VFVPYWRGTSTTSIVERLATPPEKVGVQDPADFRAIA
jgi:hypothetical protein